MNGTFQILRQELGADLRAFVDRVEELAGLELSAATRDPNLLARVAVALHHGYGAVEGAFARVAKVFATEPSGNNWHRSLLETMAMDVPEIRPAVIAEDTLLALRDLLAFRHFFRHAYAVGLDPGRLAALRDCALAAKPLLESDFGRLDAWLAELAKRT